MANLREFLATLQDLLSICEPVETFGIYPTWRPRAGRQADVADLLMRTSRTAGRAATAFERAGIGLDLGAGTPANPAVLWSTMFERAALIDARRMFTLTNQAIGVLEERHLSQAQAERGLVGLLAAFFRFPSRVRDATGLPRGSGRGRLVATATATVQGLFTAVASGVLVYPVARLFGLL